jgi:hypothetical protein
MLEGGCYIAATVKGCFGHRYDSPVFICVLNSVQYFVKDIQVKKTHSDKYARVPKHGGSLSLFATVIGLVEL